MFCTRCATFNPPTTARCGSCGARLDEHRSGRHRTGSDGRTWLLLLPFALAIAVIAVVGWRTWSVRQDQSTAYRHALAALDAGDLPEAIAQFGQAGGYRDAQEQRISTQQQLAPYQAALLDAQSALDQGQNQRAVALLRSVVAAMPENAAASNLLTMAEERFRTDLSRGITIATTNRDWLEVERLTLQLASWDGASTATDALNELRLAHSPMLFTRNGVLYQIGPDLADEATVFDGVPVSLPLWSPDRSQIAFFSVVAGSERYGALFVVDAHGEHLTLIDDSAIISPPAWSPDGQTIAYVAPGSDDPTDRTTIIRLHDLTGSPDGALQAPDGFDRLFSPTWSGAGDRLAAVATGNSAAGIVVADATSLEEQLLEIAVPADLRAVSWSPGADALLLWSSPGDSDWYAIRNSAIVLVTLDDLQTTPITTSTQAPSRPVWSPDGLHFAYLDRGSTLHVRVRTGIGDRTLSLPNKGDGIISWGPGGVGILVPALDLAVPSMLVPVGDRLGPVDPVTIRFEDNFPATDFQWGPSTAPDPELYDPLRDVTGVQATEIAVSPAA